MHRSPDSSEGRSSDGFDAGQVTGADPNRGEDVALPPNGRPARHSAAPCTSPRGRRQACASGRHHEQGYRVRDEFTAIIERDGEWFIANSPEAPGANGQGHTVEEAVRADDVTV